MSNIVLYHSTKDKFDKVDISKCKCSNDFGRGFYTTSDYSQAMNFAKLIRKRSGYTDIYIHSYLVNTQEINKLNNHVFRGCSIAWFDYITLNRISNKVINDFDIVIGPVADANTVNIIFGAYRKYGIDGNGYLKTSNDIKLKLINDLKPQVLKDQYCFKTQRAIDMLNKCSHKILTGCN